ncbi:MAG: DUF2142 domain-containing protein [Solirubrobacteraceae bacterium]|jgi:hypothetical protein
MRGRLHTLLAGRGIATITAFGLLVIGLALIATLSATHRPVLGTDSWGTSVSTPPRGHGVVCQPHETLPAETDAIRVSISPAGAGGGPALRLSALRGTRTIAAGSLRAGWRGKSATVPLAPRVIAAAPVRICIAIAAGHPVVLHGQHVSLALAATQSRERRRGVALRIDYLHAAESWWSSLPSVFQRMSWGRGFAGRWIVYFAIALMAIVAALTAALVVRDLGGEPGSAPEPRPPASHSRHDPRRVLAAVPRSAWICALIAALSAIAWSIVTPPFEGPDEPDHFAYVQVLAETGHLPHAAPANTYSPEETVVLHDLRFYTVRHHPADPSIASVAAQRHLEHDLGAGLSRVGGGAGTETTEPPLYYALEAVPYEVGARLNLLDRLALMRLLSALMAGVTALFAFLFVREALPGARWAWTVGGLGVALAPMLGFISGSVNSNSLLFAASAALFYCLARVFRRGLTTRRMVAIGAVTALGVFTNLNFLGLLAGVAVALFVLVPRRAGEPRRAAARAVAVAVLVAVIPVALGLVTGLISTAGPAVIKAQIAVSGVARGSLFAKLSYAWQLYLPPLPGMSHDFPGIITARSFWFDGLVGLYGWAAVRFASWVYDLALVPAAVVLALLVRSLATSREALRRRAPELASYVAGTLGVLAILAVVSYPAFLEHDPAYEQTRYLFPMLALLAAVFALAVRGAGARWGRVLGVLLVLAILAQDIFSQLLVASRFYA